jgi:hypothetical protein
MTWKPGMATIVRLLEANELEHVEASPEHAERLLDEAQRHVASAQRIVDDDPNGAYQLGYDALRKVGAALLAAQGLRATSTGGHVALQDAIREQFGNVMPMFGQFARFRRARNQLEYPSDSSGDATTDDVDDIVSVTLEVVEKARTVLREGVLGPFTGG